MLLVLALGCNIRDGGLDTAEIAWGDLDGDGWALAEGDCNDDNAAIHPDADEVCDALDNDCDDQTDEGVLVAWFIDADSDGYGDPATAVFNCVQPQNYIPTGEDCDDGDASISPDGVEVCNELDDDCDGEVDEDVTPSWWADEDQDGYGAGEPIEACEAPDGTVDNDFDCDDTSDAVNPVADDGCNGIDDDCDDEIDESPDGTFYRDEDGDGYGDASIPVTDCDAPTGYTDDATDCDDEDAAIHPETVWYADSDADGYGDADTTAVQCEQPSGYTLDSADCDDTLDTVSPDGVEVCDEVDQDCDGDVDEDVTTTFYEDADGDGYGTSTTTEACEEPSGYASVDGDCDDGDGDTWPGATETCDEDDDDCDGDVDEGVTTTYYADSDGDGYGDASSSTDACSAPSGYVADDTDCDDTKGARNPSASEVCNTHDDDCDGDVDEGVTTTYYADTDGDGYGDATSSTESCSTVSGYVADDTDCDDSKWGVNPGSFETCDEEDDDCDGDTDEGVTTTYYADTDGDGYGDADSTTEACSVPSGYTTDLTDCDDGASGVNPGATEICDDGIDQDCDGGPGDCGISGTVEIATDTDAEWLGDSYDYAGSSVAIGDLDDDGNDDLVVGAYYHYISSYDGWVHAVYGPTTSGGTLSSIADVTFYGAGGQQEGVGWSVEFGDFDADGVDDLAIGGNKAVYVQYGPTTTSMILNSTNADVRLAEGSGNHRFGTVMDVGDVDGDGVDDLLVGAPQDTIGVYQEGSVHLYLGGDIENRASVWKGANSSDYLGEAARVVGDTDGDGTDDILIGAPHNDANGSNVGAAYLVLGPATSSYQMSDTSLVSDTWVKSVWSSSFLGEGVGGVGDVDGDGLDDWAVGAPWANGDGSAAYGGKVAVFYGGTTGTVTVTSADILIGGAAGERLANDIGHVDADGDGNDDLVFMHSDASPSGVGTYAGSVWVLQGPISAASYATSDAAAWVHGTTNYDYVGDSWAFGDLSGDGNDDLVVGASGYDGGGYAAGGAWMLTGGSY